MAEKSSPRDTEETANDDASPGRRGWLRWLFDWQRLINLRTISAALCLSVLINMAVFFSSGKDEQAEVLKGELSLGEFHFVPDPSEETPITRADFRLHLSLLSEVDAMTRERLATHQYRVQQNVEELLRQAHGGDFGDPALTELKRQLQEKINDTIAVRGVADVIITDLHLERRDAPASTKPAETAAAVAIPGVDVDELVDNQL